MTPTVVKMTMYLLFMSLIVSFYGPSSLHSFPLTQTAVIALGFSLSRVTDVLRVIGGNVTVVQGGTVILPCKLTDTTEDLNQISWQRDTRRKPQTDNFYTIQKDDAPHFVNGEDNRFKFIGSIKDKNGSLQLSNVTLLDEGIYRCIFTLFPSGNHKTEMHLNVLVPPVISVTDNQPILGNEEVSLATCTAAGSKPPAEIKWVTDAVTEKVKVQTNSTEEADGTTTTVSSLIGVPTREINHTVQCVVTSPALSKQETLLFIIQVYYQQSLAMRLHIISPSDDSPEAALFVGHYLSFCSSLSLVLLQLCGTVIGKHQGYKRISAALQVPKSTVASIILKWKKFGTTRTLPRPGRPAKLSNRGTN
ncbi:nectin-3-like protein [Mastacembelus armatus]|uniref:nectin-3-like protein n=1 Tax=Mastacembelus armatus TaxID=205130 RepID=UPI000E45FC5E|nr:nectin-3-like protein [Mastacembelus armatus]